MFWLILSVPMVLLPCMLPCSRWRTSPVPDLMSRLPGGGGAKLLPAPEVTDDLPDRAAADISIRLADACRIVALYFLLNLLSDLLACGTLVVLVC